VRRPGTPLTTEVTLGRFWLQYRNHYTIHIHKHTVLVGWGVAQGTIDKILVAIWITIQNPNPGIILKDYLLLQLLQRAKNKTTIHIGGKRCN